MPAAKTITQPEDRFFVSIPKPTNPPCSLFKRKPTYILKRRQIIIPNRKHRQIPQILHILNLRDAVIEQRQVGEFGETVQAFDCGYVIEGQVWESHIVLGRALLQGDCWVAIVWGEDKPSH